jgi:hypothetical protein
MNPEFILNFNKVITPECKYKMIIILCYDKFNRVFCMFFPEAAYTLLYQHFKV